MLIVNVICFMITLTAIVAIGRMPTNPLGAYYHSLIGLGFPLLFNIKDRAKKYMAVTICLTAIFFRMGWIGYVCAAIGFGSFLVWKKKLRLIIFILLFLALMGFLGKRAYKELHTPFFDMGGRIEMYKSALSKWHNPWFGEGVGTFATLPENLPVFDKEGHLLRRWHHVIHSDLLQGFWALGVVRMFPIIIAFLIPFFFLRIDTFQKMTIFASYLCVIFQACIDFPFHRWTTGLLCLIIMILTYKECVDLDGTETY